MGDITGQGFVSAGIVVPAGCPWMNLAFATGAIVYPSDGVGGITTTAADSLVKDASKILLVRFWSSVVPAAGTTIAIQNHAGTLTLFNLATAVDVPLQVDIGLEVEGGFRVVTGAANADGTLTFLRIK